MPTITPKTTRAPAAAPSTASDSAKQFASFAKRTGRPSSADRSWSRGWPMSQVEFAFLTRPVAGESAPGMPTPTVPRRPVSASRSRDEAGDRLERRRRSRGGASRTRRRASARAVVVEGDAFDLRAAEVDADAHARGFSSFPEAGFKALAPGKAAGLESRREQAMKRFWILAGALVVTLGSLALAMLLGSASFDFRRYTRAPAPDAEGAARGSRPPTA